MAVREGFGKPVGEEDCLTLNIWRPADAQANLPVILFIHGGSNISGYTADPSYHGEDLARRANAVVVTVNYRLGFLGWLDLPQLKTGDAQNDSGNFALLDLTAYWNVNDRVTARIGVFNVFDETYSWWSDVRGVAADSAVIDAYTQPGRNVGLSLALRY